MSFNGELGAEKAWEGSKPCAVAGLGRATALIVRERFLTFLEVSTGIVESAEGSGRMTGTGNVFCGWPLVWAFDEPTTKCRNGDGGGSDVADSGEEEGDGSDIKGESKVEFEVVGDESVEAVVMEVTLLRWCSRCEECWGDSRRVLTSVTRTCVSLCRVSGMGISSMFFAVLKFSSPTTVMKDGKCVDMIELNSSGIFECFGKKGRFL